LLFNRFFMVRANKVGPWPWKLGYKCASEQLFYFTLWRNGVQFDVTSWFRRRNAMTLCHRRELHVRHLIKFGCADVIWVYERITNYEFRIHIFEIRNSWPIRDVAEPPSSPSRHSTMQMHCLHCHHHPTPPIKAIYVLSIVLGVGNTINERRLHWDFTSPLPCKSSWIANDDVNKGCTLSVTRRMTKWPWIYLTVIEFGVIGLWCHYH
jgi:hypothetical protein